MMTLCADSIDNDQDGLIDCADDDCALEAECVTQKRVTMVLTMMVTGIHHDCADSDCATDASCVETACDDGADNDGDGDIDCADADCVSDTAYTVKATKSL